MSDDIVFIKDINDYNEFNKIKPVIKKLNTKVKFICSDCGRESIKCYKSLKIPFLCKSCQNKISQLNPKTKEKKRQTNLLKYGVVNCFQSDDKKQKIKETLLKRYGVDNPQKSKLIKEKSENTCLEKYGYKFPGQVPEVKEKQKRTSIEKYGVDYYVRTSEFREKYKNTCLKKYGVDNYAKTDECQLKMQNTYRIKHNNKPLGISEKEKEVYKFIKSIYHNKIIRNSRKMLSGKEIDIFLPDLKLGFEFDGTYWHADPRFYKETDLILNRPALEVWNNDRNKELLCESKGIKLIRIKEYDWNKHNRKEKYRIKKEIENRKNELSLQNE